MIDVLRIAHLRIAPQEGNLEVGNCEGNLLHCITSLCHNTVLYLGKLFLDAVFALLCLILFPLTY